MTHLTQLEMIIEKAFDDRDSIDIITKGEIRESVEYALNLLDKGEVRVAERQKNGQWHVHQWLKKPSFSLFGSILCKLLPVG